MFAYQNSVCYSAITKTKKQISWFLQKLKTWKSIYSNCHILFCLWKYPKNIEVTARKCLEKFCFMAEILDFVFKLFCTDFWLLSLRPFICTQSYDLKTSMSVLPFKLQNVAQKSLLLNNFCKSGTPPESVLVYLKRLVFRINLALFTP